MVNRFLMGWAWHWQRETYISHDRHQITNATWGALRFYGQLNSSVTGAFVMDSLILLPNNGTASNDPREIERQANQGSRKQWCCFSHKSWFEVDILGPVQFSLMVLNILCRHANGQRYFVLLMFMYVNFSCQAYSVAYPCILHPHTFHPLMP